VEIAVYKAEVKCLSVMNNLISDLLLFIREVCLQVYLHVNTENIFLPEAFKLLYLMHLAVQEIGQTP
jgi:hypothetical protein